jgi:hypothetical protein
MTFQQKLLLMAGLTVVIATVVLARPSRRPFTPSDGLVAVWLAIVATALIVVGLVSHTLLRHVVQIAPLVACLVLLGIRSPWGVSAAAPLFAFWLLVMIVIWLFLLGLARIFTGTFTGAEVALTIVIGVASLLGLVTIFRRGTALAFGARFGAILGFTVLQFAAMVLSAHPFISGR